MSEEKKEITDDQLKYIIDRIENGCGHNSKYLEFFIDKNKKENEL